MGTQSEIHPQNPSGSHKIVLIACYFGKLPPYARLVLHSASYNPSIDWLIIGDQEPEIPLPKNVRFIRYTIKELEQRMARSCDTHVDIRHYYDLTRLKPTYGLCFEEHLKGYDFWGHVDLDMIYGDLRSFLPAHILETHARIYARGHLSLFRNTPEVNRHFMLHAPGAPFYKDVLANLDHRQFDEWDGIWKIYRYHRIPQYHAEAIADIWPPSRYKIRRFDALEIPNHPYQIFYWHQGKTYQAYYHREGGLFDREVAYVHFQKRGLPAPTFEQDQVAGFTIGPKGFAPYDRENLTQSEMQALNIAEWKPMPEILKEWIRGLQRKAARITGFRK
jgi:hypothetical protein